MMYPETKEELKKIIEILQTIQIKLNLCDLGEMENILFQIYNNGYNQGYADRSKQTDE